MDVIDNIAKAADRLDQAVSELILDTSILKAGKTATFNGEQGRWRRVGGMNLFLREGDGVILNGPQALSGQPMSAITADDFRAIPHVKRIYEQKGAKAVPGDDILELASGTNKLTMTADHAKAIVTKGFGKVTVTLHAKVSKGRYEKVDTRSFPTKGSSEVEAFEQAKSWARLRLRATGRDKVVSKA